MAILDFIVTILIVFYVLVLLKLTFGLRRLKKGQNKKELTVSIVVAARNEEQNISDCLQALVSQSYPEDRLEIIVVDDRSEDATADIVSKFSTMHHSVSLIQIQKTAAGVAPKKFALAKGIDRASGEIILLTDADCTPPLDWVENIVRYFEPDVGLVAGFSPLERTTGNSLFVKLVQLDALALAAVAAGSIGAGFPLTCNARNLAYRKKVYQQVNGFQEIGHLISGDDDLFLHLVRQKTEWEMRYAITQNSVVPSVVPANFAAFVNQRLRHASKGRYYSWNLKAGLAAVYLLNLILFLSLPLSLLEVKFFFIFVFSITFKSVSEFILIYKFAKFFSRQYYLKYFPLAIFFHIPYVTIFGLWGQLGKFNWKGEHFKSTTEVQAG